MSVHPFGRSFAQSYKWVIYPRVVQFIWTQKKLIYLQAEKLQNRTWLRQPFNFYHNHIYSVTYHTMFTYFELLIRQEFIQIRFIANLVHYQNMTFFKIFDNSRNAQPQGLCMQSEEKQFDITQGSKEFRFFKGFEKYCNIKGFDIQQRSAKTWMLGKIDMTHRW